MSKSDKRKRPTPRSSDSTSELLWNNSNYLWIGIGAVLIIIGLLLMMGGGMNSPYEWHPEKIYSFRRVTLGPLIILIGLIIEVYSIFKKGA